MRVVLAYSGGLDTSVILAWLREEYHAEVITYTADVGQGEEVSEAAEKAMATGAVEALVDDLREAFVTGAVFPALRAGAIYESEYLLGTALARPIITQGLVKAALQHGADAIAHGATGKGNDQVRFELATAALAPQLKVIAPWREWKMSGRSDLVSYAAGRGIDVPVTKEKPYSIDANLFHSSYEGGVLEDPWTSPPEDMYQLTVNPETAADSPQDVLVGFERGNPVSIDGEYLDPVDLLTRANQIAGSHGVGRVDIVENRYVGIKSRGVYETPGGTLLHAARRAIESITLDREILHLRLELAQRYATIVYNGYWFSPERLQLQSMFDSVASAVTGEARIRLFRGAARIVGRRAPRSLYSEEAATFESDVDFQHTDAAGFINLKALRVRGFGTGETS